MMQLSFFVFFFFVCVCVCFFVGKYYQKYVVFLFVDGWLLGCPWKLVTTSEVGLLSNLSDLQPT